MDGLQIFLSHHSTVPLGQQIHHDYNKFTTSIGFVHLDIYFFAFRWENYLGQNYRKLSRDGEMASRISIFEERSFGYVELFFGFTFGRLGEAVIAKSISGREAKGGHLGFVIS